MKDVYECKGGLADLKSLFRDEATKEVLQFIENTEVSRLMTKEDNRNDY